jgi:hypothetical protein
LQNCYKLSDTGDHKEHASSVFRFNARKVFSDALSYSRIQTVDQYLKEVVRQPVDNKRGASSFYLTEEQYGEVMYLTTIYPQLMMLQIPIQTMEYICRSEYHGWKIIYQVTLLCASTGLALNSSKCQRSEGRTEVMSLNTPTTSIDISMKLSAW